MYRSEESLLFARVCLSFELCAAFIVKRTRKCVPPFRDAPTWQHGSTSLVSNFLLCVCVFVCLLRLTTVQFCVEVDRRKVKRTLKLYWNNCEVNCALLDQQQFSCSDFRNSESTLCTTTNIKPFAFCILSIADTADCVGISCVILCVNVSSAILCKSLRSSECNLWPTPTHWEISSWTDRSFPFVSNVQMVLGARL